MQDNIKAQTDAEKEQEALEENAAENTAENTAENAAASEDEKETLSVEAKLAAAEQKAAEMQDAFLRARAEMENVRRRTQEDVAKAHKFAVENFAKSMLSVKDSLEMSLRVDAPTVESIREGVEATLRQMTQVFEQNKLIAIMPQQGDKLDPTKHQAISTVPSEQEANTVVDVLQKGYTLADRLIRPAVVTVAAAKKA